MAHALSSGTTEISEQEQHWVQVGIGLNKVLAPTLRRVVETELEGWHDSLCKPPAEIDKQNFVKHMKKLPPSKNQLKYQNINNNIIHKLPSAYDYGVKDALSLARLFVQPFMAHFAGFDETIDMSALLTILCEAAPFESSGVAAEAKKVRTDVRNPWAHCNFSEWTAHKFNISFQAIESLVKRINLPAADEKKVCDELDFWKQTEIFVDGRHAKLVNESVAELSRCVKKLMNVKVEEKLANLQTKLLCRIEEVEKCAARNLQKLGQHSKELGQYSKELGEHSKELEEHSKELGEHSKELGHHSKKIESLETKVRMKQHYQQKENYSDFSKKKVPYGLRNLPRDMVKRPSEVNEIIRLLTEGNSRVGVVRSRGGQSDDVVGIRGMGGLGKTVLALAVALEVSVFRQVIWLDIGETPDCLALINRLIQVLGGNVSFSDVRAAQSWVKSNTHDKDCLVVLDDVWSVNDADVFDHLSGKCQLLITTRVVNVVRGLRGFVYELDKMKQDESRALFYRCAGIKPDELSSFSPNMQEIIKELLKECNGLPLALSLVGSNLNHTRSEQDWKDILDEFNTDLEEIRSMFPTDEYPYDNMIKAINVSFKHLKKCEQEKFLDFAIFPEDTSIPSDILELFWSSEGFGRTSCKPLKARRILEALEGKSMIQKEPELQEKTSYRVHDLLLDFARKKLKATGTLTDVQRLFVKTLLCQCVNGEWNISSTSNQKDYYFKYLPYHIYSSEQQSELLQLFFDLHWLQQKVKHTNIPSVVSDFRFLDPLTEEMKLLKSSLMLSANVIEKDPNSICPQLLGRLLSYKEEYPRVKMLIEQLQESGTKTCHLLPSSACLNLGGPEISRKIFDSSVLSLATRKSSAVVVVICGLGNGAIIIFDLETGEEVQQLLGHQDRVRRLALSPSETILASGSFDKTARLWNMNSYEQLSVLQLKSLVTALDFSVDGQRLFIGSNDGYLSSFAATGSYELLKSTLTSRHLATASRRNNSLFGNMWCDVKTGYQSPLSVNSLCTTTDGQYVATASCNDKSINLWKADTLDIETTLVGHRHDVMCVVETDSGKDIPMLVSASWDETIKVWNLKTYQEIRTFEGFGQDVARSVAVSDDQKYFMSGGDDKIVRFWCFQYGKLISCFEGHTHEISCVAILSDGTRAVSASYDGSVRVWRAASPNMEQERSSDNLADITDIALSRDNYMCVFAYRDDTFKIWNFKTTEQCIITLRGEGKSAKSVAVSADNLYFVSLSKKDRRLFLIKVWNFHNRCGINEIVFKGKPEIVRFSSDGEQVIIACKDYHLRIWYWRKSDACLKKVILPALHPVEIACDQSMIYTCSWNMHVCKINVGSLEVSTVRQGLPPPVLSPNGNTVIRGVMNEFICKNITGSVVKYNAGHPVDSKVTAIDTTFDGKSILSGSCSGTLSLVNLDRPGKYQTSAKTESGVGIRFVCVLGDDVRFVFVDDANRIELRTFDNNEIRIELGQPNTRVTCITALGSNYILLGCDDGKLVSFYVGNISSCELQAHLEAISQVSGDLEDPFRRFVSGSITGSVKLWNVEKNSLTLMWARDDICSDPITALAFVPRSSDIVVGCGEEVKQINANRVVDTYCGGRVETIRVASGSVFGAFSETKNIHNGVDGDISVMKWFLEQESCVGSYRFKERILRVNNSCGVVAILGNDYLIIWNFKTGETLHRLPIQDAKDITALTVVPGGEFLLTALEIHYGENLKPLKLWKLQNGECVEEFHFDQGIQFIACVSNGMVCVGLQGGRVCFLRFNSLSSNKDN